MAFNPTYKTVWTEDCNISYWYQGSGPLLIMIPGGGGVGRQFNPIMPYLDQQFTVCTYDRRQNGASKAKVPRHLNMAQQARDVIAIIKDMGFEKACIFGTSGGAVISFQMAVSYPEYIDRLVAHEAPTLVVLDDTTHHLNRAFMLIETYREQGVDAAFARFKEEHKGYENSPQSSEPDREDSENFWKYEFIYFTIYCPDLRHILKNKVSIAVAAGDKSADAWYARTTLGQAEVLGCKRYVFPGHHTGHESEPDVYAPHLLRAYQDLKTVPSTNGHHKS